MPGFYDMVKQRLEHPRIVPGISDAGAHLNIFQVILPPASGVSNEGPRSRVLGALAGCFLALGSGLGLVGTVSSRRSKRAKNGKKRSKNGRDTA